MNSVAQAKAPLATWYYPANLVTELRLLAVPVVLVAVAYRRFGWALLIAVAASASDGFDGWLARRFHQFSKLGGYLDPAADKLLCAGLFIALALDHQLPWALTILVFTRDLCILTSALVLYLGTSFRDFQPTWWGKASTTAELATVVVALLDAWSPHPITLHIDQFGWCAVTFFSVFSGIHYAFTSAQRYHHTQHV